MTFTKYLMALTAVVIGTFLIPQSNTYTQDSIHRIDIQTPAIPKVEAAEFHAYLEFLPTNRSPISENTYTPGNCTWYVANKRYVPNGLGNAATWYYRAPSYGLYVSDVPKAGAIAWKEPGETLGHVAYVEQVNPDGTVYISEMNVLGLYVISYRTTPASYWKYIY